MRGFAALLCGKPAAFRKSQADLSAARLRLAHRLTVPTISRDSPGIYITAVTQNRLPVFRTETIKTVVASALDEARQSGGFALLAYVIMPNHLHMATDGVRKPSDVLRYAKGIISRRVIGYLREHGYQSSLEKLRHEKKVRGHEYSLWQHHSSVMLLTSENVFMQRVHYTHQNPVRAGPVERAEEYRWSSARCWAHRPAENEPLRIDLERIVWRALR
jgi:putative transposase